MYTISNVYKHYRTQFNYPCIELENGMKVNPNMYWYMVELGLIDPYKD